LRAEWIRARTPRTCGGGTEVDTGDIADCRLVDAEIARCCRRFRDGPRTLSCRRAADGDDPHSRRGGEAKTEGDAASIDLARACSDGVEVEPAAQRLAIRQSGRERPRRTLCALSARRAGWPGCSGSAVGPVRAVGAVLSVLSVRTVQLLEHARLDLVRRND